ncbi:MAG: hypothetical protein ACOZNI_30130 [Myxococcota bacterium]
MATQPDLAGAFRATLPDALAAELDERLAVPITVDARRSNRALAEEYLAAHVAQVENAIQREIEAAGGRPPDFEMVVADLVPDLLSYIRARLHERPPPLYGARRGPGERDE